MISSLMSKSSCCKLSQMPIRAVGLLKLAILVTERLARHSALDGSCIEVAQYRAQPRIRSGEGRHLVMRIFSTPKVYRFRRGAETGGHACPNKPRRDAEARPDSCSGCHPTSTRSEQGNNAQDGIPPSDIQRMPGPPDPKARVPHLRIARRNMIGPGGQVAAPQGRPHTSHSAQPKSNAVINICSFPTSPRIGLHLAMPSGGAPR
jgi:hypothetical protein